ncbi:MAG: amidophosphoribosyltransferase [Dehalococcoidia bacterium]|nr:amidophosphoribosyltransferase [Dehalococcoidia bacterium]
MEVLSEASALTSASPLVPDSDALREKCGVFGVYAPGEEVARLTFFGLHAIQHRGQESAGIATTDGFTIHHYAAMGLVTQVFDEAALSGLRGFAAIGHTRYSTTGSSVVRNAQPFIVDGIAGQIAIAHNGNIVNADLLRADLEERGVRFDTGTDSEVLAALAANAPGETWEERLELMMRRASGAYSLTMLTTEALFGIRDPNGIRPLCIGRLNDGTGAYVLASETCALDQLGAEFVREVAPGEIVRIDATGLRSTLAVEPQRAALCMLEYIYFARLDSRLGGNLLYSVRIEMGAQLAREHPVEADMVIGVPESASAAAIGYARESGIPYVEALVKNRYVGRTFIQPDQRIRERGVQMKLNPMRELLEGKRVIVVDDTIVRGTTTTPLVAMLRKVGAREVHMRITAPPIEHPCFYGVDMASKAELIAAHRSVEEIREYIGADSLGYLSLEGTANATGAGEQKLCTACFSGNYPSPVPLQLDKFLLENQDERERHGLEVGAAR